MQHRPRKQPTITLTTQKSLTPLNSALPSAQTHSFCARQGPLLLLFDFSSSLRLKLIRSIRSSFPSLIQLCFFVLVSPAEVAMAHLLHSRLAQTNLSIKPLLQLPSLHPLCRTSVIAPKLYQLLLLNSRIALTIVSISYAQISRETG